MLWLTLNIDWTLDIQKTLHGSSMCIGNIFGKKCYNGIKLYSGIFSANVFQLLGFSQTTITVVQILLTHSDQDKMATILQMAFPNAFSWMKMFKILFKISLKFVPTGPIDDKPALVQIMACRRAGDKPLSEPMMFSLLRHICITRPQWVKQASGK